jgi:hypothetical protein
MTDEMLMQVCEVVPLLSAFNIVSSWYELSFGLIDQVNVTSAKIETVLDVNHELACKILLIINQSNLIVFSIGLL